MNVHQVEEKYKVRKEKAKQAVALAMNSRWEEAVDVNRSILLDYPDGLEACNRLGKALSEIGRNREAKDAFYQALAISPSNAIAKKNLDRLTRLADETPRSGARNRAAPKVFIEERGKAAVTSLTNLGPSDVLAELAPALALHLEAEGSRIRVLEPSGKYVGQVQSKWTTRLIRLIKGGNKYEAAVTSVGERELTIIVREVHKDPSQANVPSFPSQAEHRRRAYVSGTLLGQELSDEETTEEGEPIVVKDWSDDDTEPGDDDAYTPVVHRIINSGDNSRGEEEED